MSVIPKDIVGSILIFSPVAAFWIALVHVVAPTVGFIDFALIACALLASLSPVALGAYLLTK